jgi:hypothetical protein
MFKKSKLSVGLTAFLDVLGFGAELENVTTSADIEALLQAVSLIRKAFDYKPDDPDVRAMQKAFGKAVLAFSDSVIVNVPVASEMTRLEGSFDGLMSELHSMAVAQANCVENGLFLRGGVDLDWWYRDGSVLASKGLAVAYALEGESCVPVIAISENLRKFLSGHAGRTAYSKSSDPFPGLIRHYSGVVHGKAIDIQFLDYLSTFAREIDWTPSLANRNHLLTLPSDDRDKQLELWRQENLAYWFAGHARLVELAHSRAAIPSVAAKYKWLADYHNDIASNWVPGEPSCVCVV